MKKSILFATIMLLFVGAASMQAQVTVGSDKAPEGFSVLELINNGSQGLRLPQMTTTQRNAITDAAFKANPLAKGLQIYNTNSNCVEYWNGTQWVSLCSGQANITFAPNAPNEPSFPSTGGDRGPFTPLDDPNCTTENPAFTFTVMTGNDYLYVNVINEATGEFNVSIAENPTALSRSAILRITNNCSQEYKEFVFSQAGDDSGCGSTSSIPAIASVNGTSLCSDGAVYLYLPGASAGTFIWTLNGVEVGRGINYIATQAGTYIVYGDKIGCSVSQSITVTTSTTQAPNPIQVIVGENNGFVCSAGGETMLFASTTGSGTIVWYKDGARQAGKTGSYISAGIGKWFAVAENGSCSSAPSNTVQVSLHPNAGSGDINPITFTINGQSPSSSNISLCSGGSLLLAVVSPQADVTYTWYAGDSQTGVTLGTGATLSTTVAAVQAYPVLQCIGEKPNSCAQAQYTQFTISAINNPPARPTISSNTGTVMCGTATELTATAAGATSYIWTKDGSVLAGETSNTLVVIGLGIYTVYAKSGDCVSIESVAFNINAASGFSGDLTISGNATPNINSMETYTATMTNATGATYTWTVPSPHTIVSGQGTSSITVQLASATSAFALSVMASNACGSASPNPATFIVTPGNPCAISIVGHSPASKSVSVQAGTSPTLSVTANSANAITYQWYSNTSASTSGGTALGGQTSASLSGQTSLAAGNHYFYCVATASCGSNPTATSDVFTVSVTQNVETLQLGSGTLAGRTCFDIAESTCDNVVASTRNSNKANFALATGTPQNSSSTAPFTRIQNYVFTANTSNVSNVRYQLSVVGGNLSAADLIDGTPISGTLWSGTLASGSSATLTLTYKNDLNSKLAGVSRDDASKIRLSIIYWNGSQDVKVETIINIQDCSCCGAFTAANVFKVFMCHNLGADETRDSFTAHQGLHGNMYKWGTGQVALSASENISGTTGAIANWTTSVGGVPPTTTADWNMSTANPCPAGYRVPTKAEWDGVINASLNPVSRQGSWSNDANNSAVGTKFGTALFLPAAGYRNNSNGSLGYRGYYGYYWSSTVGSAYNAYCMYFGSTGQGTHYNASKSFGLSVRCIAAQ